MKTIFTNSNLKFTGLTMVCLTILISFSFAQTTHVVEVSNNKFTPSELEISAGDIVEWQNIQGWHNVNGTQGTYPSNPESFGNSAGSGWTYSHVFSTPGHYDYRCDPHYGLGMVGKIDVKESNMNDDTTKYMLTLMLESMNPHVGQTMYLSVVDKDSGKEIERKKEDIQANFSVQVSHIEKNHSYWVNFFADHNGNGMYDAPPVDHAWRMELNDVMGDTTLLFTHNTNFTDIMWQNKLTVHFMNMNPHVGQNLQLAVIDKNSGTEIQRVSAIVESDFMVDVFGIENGMSYNVDFFADHNGNGMYDAPPVDHAWRMELNDVMGDTTLMFTHNTNFTDIGMSTGLSDHFSSSIKMYPNPVKERFTIETGDINFEILNIRLYDISGELKMNVKKASSAKIEMDIHQLPAGVYFVELTTESNREMLKLMKN